MFLEYNDYEKLALATLRRSKIKPDDERVGDLISYLMTADSKYNESIGNRNSFRIMYANFWVKSFKRKKRQDKLVGMPSEDYMYVTDSLIPEDFWENFNNDNRFSDIYKKIFFLRFKESYSYKDIETKLNIKNAGKKISWLLVRLKDLKPNYIF